LQSSPFGKFVIVYVIAGKKIQHNGKPNPGEREAKTLRRGARGKKPSTAGRTGVMGNNINTRNLVRKH
jgi:hypothetical protein